MRKINNIVLHCTATTKDTKVENIVKYWRDRLGWKNPGYHFIIDADGHTTQLQPIEKPTNGVRGHNSDSIHVSYIGGRDFDDRSLKQIAAQTGIVKVLHAMFPDAKICGHRDFKGVTKKCPNFDVSEWLKTIDL